MQYKSLTNKPISFPCICVLRNTKIASDAGEAAVKEAVERGELRSIDDLAAEFAQEAAITNPSLDEVLARGLSDTLPHAELHLKAMLAHPLFMQPDLDCPHCGGSGKIEAGLHVVELTAPASMARNAHLN